MTRSDEPMRSFEIAQRSPLVLLAILATPEDAGDLAGQLLEDFRGERFSAIVFAEDGDALGPLLAGLAPVLEEMIFTATASPRAVRGDLLAFRALDDLGVGQDFVYTVPRIPDAVAYALAVLAAPRRQGWEGTAVLVAGREDGVAEARAFLASHGPGIG